jgi:hypothetical protein
LTEATALLIVTRPGENSDAPGLGQEVSTVNRAQLQLFDLALL